LNKTEVAQVVQLQIHRLGSSLPV